MRSQTMKGDSHKAMMFRCGWNDVQYGLTEPTALNPEDTAHEWAERVTRVAREVLSDRPNDHYTRGSLAAAEAFLNGEAVSRLTA